MSSAGSVMAPNSIGLARMLVVWCIPLSGATRGSGTCWRRSQSTSVARLLMVLNNIGLARTLVVKRKTLHGD